MWVFDSHTNSVELQRVTDSILSIKNFEHFGVDYLFVFQFSAQHLTTTLFNSRSISELKHIYLCWSSQPQHQYSKSIAMALLPLTAWMWWDHIPNLCNLVFKKFICSVLEAPMDVKSLIRIFFVWVECSHKQRNYADNLPRNWPSCYLFFFLIEQFGWAIIIMLRTTWTVF